MGRNVLIDQNIFWKTIPNMEQGCHFLFFFPRIIQTFRHLDIHLLLRIVHDKIGFHVFRCQFSSRIFTRVCILPSSTLYPREASSLYTAFSNNRRRSNWR